MPDAFVAIDLDNVLGGRGPKEYGCLGKGREATLAELKLALEVILRRLNWTIGGGRATMNRATQDWIDPGVIDLLRDHKIPIGVVPNLKERADKELFQELGFAAGRKYRHFVIISGDSDFIQSAELLKKRVRDAQIAVLVGYPKGWFISDYRKLSVRVVDVQEGQASPRSNAHQARHTGSRGRSTGSRRPTGSRRRPGMKAPLAIGGEVMLQCDLCGQRCLLEFAPPRAICPGCGTKMRAGANVYPAGSVPFDDGPVLLVGHAGRVARIEVLTGESLALGRREDPISGVHVGLNAILGSDPEDGGRSPGSLISRRQVEFSRSKKSRVTVRQCSETTPMFRTLRGGLDALPREVNVALGETEVLYINNPDEPDKAASVVQLVLLNPLPEARASRRRQP